MKRIISFFVFALTLSAVGLAFAQSLHQPGVGTGPGVRYATDAYPGFDDVPANTRPEVKKPRLFAWLNGPKAPTAAEQYAWCRLRLAEGEYRAARKGFDALVRQWPASPEAPLAQKDLADLVFAHDRDCEQAFKEYCYLLDFYPSKCDFSSVAEDAYEMARRMQREGKSIVFFRFANTVDVRRSFEALVMRVPGAEFVPQAMLTIASLRVDEGKFSEAVSVYENLRSIRPESDEAIESVGLEAEARLQLLRDHGYNRPRCLDTIAFLRQSLEAYPSASWRERVGQILDDARGQLEEEAFRSAKFYDSRTRTKRSAITAYEAFVRDYPASVHVDEAVVRLKELKEEASK